MLRLQIYVNNILLFTILVPANTTLRQLIAKISVKYNILLSANSVTFIGDEILPSRLKFFYPVFNDEEGNKLFTGNYFTVKDLNLCITKTMGLNLKDNDAIFISDNSKSQEYNLSFIYHCGKNFKSFLDLDGVGQSEFIEAAKYGDIVTLKEILSLNLTYLDATLSGALYVAIVHYQIHAVKLLLFEGAKGNYTNDMLILAIKYNYLDIVDLLLIHNAATLNPTSSSTSWRIRRSVRSPLMGRYLLENGLKPSSLNEQVYFVKHYIGSFFEAATNGIYPKNIQNVIIQYALPDVTDPQFDLDTSFCRHLLSFYTPLFSPLSSFQDKTEKSIIKQILKNLDYALPPKKIKQQLHVNLSKFTALPDSIKNMMQSILSQLGDDEEKPYSTSMALPDLKTSEEIPLRGHNSENILEYCLHHYDVMALKSNLHIISHIDTEWIVKALKIEIERARSGLKEDENISDILLKKKFGAITYGVTLRGRDKALHDAVKSNNILKVKALLSEGATLDASIFYQYGTTPVHLAIEYAYFSMLDFLISENANLNVRDKNNRTAIELAYQKNNSAIMSLLIQNGGYQGTFKSLHPLFLANYVSQFFTYILTEVLPEKTPVVLIQEILQYILDRSDFEDVSDFNWQVKRFYQKEFPNKTVDTLLPPKTAMKFLLFKPQEQALLTINHSVNGDMKIK